MDNYLKVLTMASTIFLAWESCESVTKETESVKYKTSNVINNFGEKKEIVFKFPIDEKNVTNDKWKTIITYYWKEYDLSEYEEKVIDPVNYIVGEDKYIDDLVVIGMIENMGSIATKQEIEATFELFSEENYIDKVNQQSHKWAIGLFQVMPATSDELDKRYKVSEKNRNC